MRYPVFGARRAGFTLIELLIVVAIIAILAAIAVPNFLEAQVRAKTARSKADIRTLATAIEAYVIDNNGGPTDRGNNAPGRPYDLWDDKAQNYSVEPKGNFTIGFELTTPIAYLGSVACLQDPFRVTKPTGQSSGREYYGFFNFALRKSASLASAYGNWMIMGAGPDGFVNNAPNKGYDYSNATYIPRGRNYDPSNGTVSNGDIYRSQKYNEAIPERTNLSGD